MKYQSINPFNNRIIAEHQEFSDNEIQEIISDVYNSYLQWRNASLDKRISVVNQIKHNLNAKIEYYAESITNEMGKPITESIAEIKKCSLLCDYYIKNAEAYLTPNHINTDVAESYVEVKPMGVVLGIMPWNFPFWQVFRFAIPNIIGGNTVLVKHATNVLNTAKLIESSFNDSEREYAVYRNIIIGHDKVESIIADKRIVGVSLTGSEKAGSTVASMAGKYIKKALLELGGSNAFIVFDDADVELAVDLALKSRMQNSGQSCIASKRIILTEKIYDKFLQKFILAVKDLRVGNPMDSQTQITVLARKDLALTLDNQVKKSIEMGADLVLGGRIKDAYYSPTILTNVTQEMPVFKEETFGPVAAIIKVKDNRQAIKVAANTDYGLGASIISKDIEMAKSLADELGDGAVFINDFVKSDPRLPFGGTKLSGYGRELSQEGLLEFMNIKTIYIK